MRGRLQLQYAFNICKKNPFNRTVHYIICIRYMHMHTGVWFQSHRFPEHGHNIASGSMLSIQNLVNEVMVQKDEASQMGVSVCKEEYGLVDKAMYPRLKVCG